MIGGGCRRKCGGWEVDWTEAGIKNSGRPARRMAPCSSLFARPSILFFPSLDSFLQFLLCKLDICGSLSHSIYCLASSGPVYCLSFPYLLCHTTTTSSRTSGQDVVPWQRSESKLLIPVASWAGLVVAKHPTFFLRHACVSHTSIYHIYTGPTKPISTLNSITIGIRRESRRGYSREALLEPLRLL